MAAIKKWSKSVTEHSNAMDVDAGTFRQSDPKKIARAVEHDAEKSNRRKSSPYRAAMSMLTFYINRAGKNLTAKQRKTLEEAKNVLRDEFGPDSGAAKKKPASRKTSGRKKVVRNKVVRKIATRKKTSRKKSSRS
jgi:hypothetical protein